MANSYSFFRTRFSSHLLQEAFSNYYKLGWHLFWLWLLLASLHPAHSGLTQLVHALFDKTLGSARANAVSLHLGSPAKGLIQNGCSVDMCGMDESGTPHLDEAGLGSQNTSLKPRLCPSPTVKSSLCPESISSIHFPYTLFFRAPVLTPSLGWAQGTWRETRGVQERL